MPEVEITRRHLESAMVGNTLVEVSVGHDRTSRRNASRGEVEGRLTGRRVQTVGRHGKFLVIGLDEGYTMIGHLGMSGRYQVVEPLSVRETHTHFVALLDSGKEIRFVDPRTFGFVAVLDEDEISESSLTKLGPDAWLDPPDGDELGKALSGRTAPIKALLLDQNVVAGLGNIYADEVLYLSHIHPLTPGGALDEDNRVVLISAMAEVLTDAIERGGTTLDDLAFLLPDGQAGDNLKSLSVYGRTDLPCTRCGTAIERVIVRGRSTHFCPECQQYD